AGDVIEVKFDMTPKLNRANPGIAQDSGRGAVTVGPVVYCAEGADNGDVFGFSVDGSALKLNRETPADLGGFAPTTDDLGTIYTVTAGGIRLVPEDPEALYFADSYREEAAEVKLIPYFMWGNRGVNPMRIWMPVK
ncbi:MAG: hypothetical protein E7579_11880, partial [Ruminococcaceae bacterium]|nr:hypothetical protein [Oscillospiraceae bacterium]